MTMTSRTKEDSANATETKVRKPQKKTEYAYLAPAHVTWLSNGLTALDAQIKAKQEKLVAADLADMAAEFETERGDLAKLRQRLLSASAIRLHFQGEAA
jgi:hypothetical protein